MNTTINSIVLMRGAQRHSRPLHALATTVGTFAALAMLGLYVPAWLTYLITVAAGNALVSLGIVTLMRGGVVSFGQGMFFAAGGYGAALLFNHAGWTDALALAIAGGALAMVLALPFAPLLARYRGIFFATLTLALSMVAYGVLMKWPALGGSDGFTVGRSTLLGQRLDGPEGSYKLFLLTMAFAAVIGFLARAYFASPVGLVTLAARDNELRVEYLGASVRRLIGANFLMAALFGGVGGALVVLSLGHVEPAFSYWTTSGEFVFIAVLAGYRSVPAVFIASFLLEIVRSFSSAYFPNTWQLVLGLFLLLVIRFLPQGIGSLWTREAR
ncbi:branched-chain amino acid ABC transporter permease [Variovorax boronicumulans]|uniref:branched-chain amino acid ABC transporter permease n=1 Tax=Variovorax boronicumulans TaxID=436515 RepID=UPI000A443584|nr:branched-chain amino acid ABC transporter permease [Variovorax boronicumulans]